MSKLYSTGPIENAINITTPSVSSNIIIKLLNNNLNQIAEVVVKVFRLNGTKTQIYSNTIRINPNSSALTVVDVSDVLEFEVQIKVIKCSDHVLIGVFGEDANGLLVAAQRLVHSELTEIYLPKDCCKQL